MEKSAADQSLVAIENLIENYSPEFESIESNGVMNFLTELQNIVASNNTLILKTINELLSLNFFVDDYQRGYKWMPQQVTELLNDIHEFKLGGEDFYCLQPVVVKHHGPENTGQRGRWELIDGQQRMTTVYMILSYLEHNKYSIDYRTRTGSGEFLKQHLKNSLSFKDWDEFLNQHINDDQISHLDNVDNYHFYTAYQVIHNWFSSEGRFNEAKDRDYWLDKLLNHTKVIWYAAREGNESLDKQQSIDVFMRINSGKIPLTNAELIKALFLHGVAGSESGELATLQQSEMAQQWDAIEHGLQEDEFWAFLNTSEKSLDQSSRIELLFNLLSKKPNSANKNDISTQDKFFAFNFYNNKIREGGALNDTVQELWHDVKQGYYRLLEWYKDDELYHLTGFLISRKIQSVDKLWKLAERKGKSEFILSLKELVSDELNKYFKPAVPDNDGQSNVEAKVAKLDFTKIGYETKNRKKIISLLILLNISVHRNNKTRLSFKTYREESWDIEHIHAQQSKLLSDEAEANAWYEDQLAMLESTDIPENDIEHLKTSLSDWNSARLVDLKAAKDTFKKYLSDLAEIVGEFKEEDENALDNLCLLPASVNRGIGNEIFSKKRQKIIDYEKGHDQANKQFIPAATKYIFSKYYSESVSQMHKWSTSDRNSYKKVLIGCFEYYGSMEGLS